MSAEYRKLNDRSLSSSTYHKKDGTNVRAILKKETWFETMISVEPNPECGCHNHNPNAWWMVVCEHCGNKRCPHATDCRHECTNSNAPDQDGSVYGHFKCVECWCKSFSFVDEQKQDGSFGPSNVRRCHNCKLDQ